MVGSLGKNPKDGVNTGDAKGALHDGMDKGDSSVQCMEYECWQVSVSQAGDAC